MRQNEAFYQLVQAMQVRRWSVTNAVIGDRLSLSPWSHSIGNSWMDGAPDFEGNVAGRCNKLGNITLFPAPGEVMKIDLQALDDGLGTVRATVILSASTLFVLYILNIIFVESPKEFNVSQLQ